MFHNSPAGRENTEWSNFWYSRANQNLDSKDKILIIGDSTGRKIRSTVELLSGKSVDFFGTSAGLHDLLFISQLKAFFSVVYSNYYDVIYIWLGYHSLKNEEGADYTDHDFEVFKDDYNSLIVYLSKYGRNIFLCSALYPVIKKSPLPILERIWFHIKPLSRLSKETILWEEACIIKRKNDIVKSLAESRGLSFCDVNGYILSLCEHYRTRCIHYDKIHYEGKSYAVIARFFLNSLDK